MTANAHSTNPFQGRLFVATLWEGGILVLMSITCSGSGQPDVLGQCILAWRAVVDATDILEAIDRQVRPVQGHGSERLANRRDRQCDASKNRAVSVDASKDHDISPKDMRAIADNPWSFLIRSYEASMSSGAS
jgi:hypothetical protein